jgi:hypothetical protein
MAFVQLINIAYIKQYTVVNDSVEANLANPAIKLAQDKFIKSYLGTNLYDKIIADVAAGTISGDYLDLLNDYIKPMLLWRTMVELYPSLYVKVQNGSIVLRTSDDTQTLDQSFINKLVADANNNAQHYTQDFIDYMRHYNNLFPEYNTNTNNQKSPKRDNYNENSMVFSSGNNDISSNNRSRFDGDRRDGINAWL